MAMTPGFHFCSIHVTNNSTENINSVSYCFKMFGIYTGWIPADMIKFQSIWDRTHIELIRKMGSKPFATLVPEPTITLGA